MKKFSFGDWKNQVVDTAEDIENNEILLEWVNYILTENKKGKIPLVIVGAGISASKVKAQIKSNEKSKGEDNSLKFQWLDQGLPCLQQMMIRLKKMVLDSADENDNDEFKSLKEQFEIMNDNMSNINREWLGRIFTNFEKSSDEKIRGIWKKFCEWFFFSCIEYTDAEGNVQYCGALDTKTSGAANEIVKLYDSVNAICLSANFDNYINYALTETEGNRKGVAIFERRQAELYLKRNRRGKEKFENKPYNRCVLHANGDVFWLYCSGEKGEGYCPNTNIRKPAFDNKTISCAEDLCCDFCGSPLVATMTMPGTYEKDYNTRTIIETIWKYLSAKISAVVTVGISCNWDDVILKFILQLMKEMDIPLLDINNFSDKAKDGKSQLVELVVRQSYLEACSLNMTAEEGVKILNDLIEDRLVNAVKPETKEQDCYDYKEKILNTLKNQKSIKRLKQVSQLGLKSYWLESEEKNERWGHSIEVADIATKMYAKLIENSNKENSIHERALLYAAGLLHDCGHLPFSHLLEDVFEELAWNMQGETETFRHSHYTKWLIRCLCEDRDNGFYDIIGKYGVLPDEIIHLIEGRYGVAYIDVLLNSALDADKIAYIFTDAERSNRNLTLKREEFLDKLLSSAYITQEGMVALDGESACYAMRLLDERRRMYDELYYDTRIRCLETMAKYIITTYFVQKYNSVDLILGPSFIDGKREDGLGEENGKGEILLEDMGNQHILASIEDLYSMIEKGSYVLSDMSASVGDKIKESIERCMQLILKAKRSSGKEPKELKILGYMSRQLLGKEIEKTGGKEDHLIYMPYRDRQLDELVEKLNYEELTAVRKKIILNYPGTILIDIYKTAKYFSPSVLRAARNRPDGTACEQTTILVPSAPKDEWQIQKSKAEISLSEYAERNNIDKERKTIFHVFHIGRDAAACEHAISMLKKEMKRIRR